VPNSRDPETLARLAEVTGARAAAASEAVRDAALVVIAIPARGITDLPSGLFDGAPDSLAIVDIGNYYPRERDGRIEAIENGMTESRWVANELRRPVVKAFNNVLAQHLLERGRPPGTGRAIRSAAPVG
jgi:predicted dinucleotide-binding enzyme